MESSPITAILSSDGESTTTTKEGEELFKCLTPCSNCQQLGELDIQKATIPHFNEVILMCMVCDHCHFKTTEIMNSWSVSSPTYATKLSLSVKGIEDLNREIILSDTATICIPHLELEQQEGGGFGGICTTVEGLLKKLLLRLEKSTPFGFSNKANDVNVKQAYEAFLFRLRLLSEGKYFPFTLIIDDPLSASHIGPKFGMKASDDDDDDSALVIERTERVELE